ncbi:FAD/NAD(P)-binding protein [Streptomyces albireticuli]|uniref:FAD/NAD(P)-binding protein n=1 Tax=Streptomyces albireticuli TaxID=1940 RepID=UPI0027E36D5A|nr:FAD/NAD(P)-binding protein [Streptomyces albireticuli]
MLRIGIVGVGPRGLSVLERLVANARAHPGPPAVVELFEPWGFGSGEVWRTDQPPHLIMNIVACQITAFADRSVRMSGPLYAGPSLYGWAVALAAGRIPGAYPAGVLDQARSARPGSYCRRSFYGHYLQWAHREILLRAPARLTVRGHHTRIVAVTDTPAGRQRLTCERGRVFEVDQLVLATGHTPVRPTGEEAALARFAARTGGCYQRPASPADTDLGPRVLPPGRPLIVRGLGLSFFDHMALLTTGRGGTFTREASGRLRYLPSGGEPHLICGSRRGVPLHARADNEKGDGRHEPVFLTQAAARALRERAGPGGGADFRRDCWPLIAKEVETVYYTRLVAEAASPATAREFHALYVTAPWSSGAEQQILRKFRLPGHLRWDWARIARPWDTTATSSPAAWRAFLRAHLLADVAQARRGNLTSALKSALDVLRDIRNEIRAVINDGGVGAESYRTDVRGWFTPLHAYLSLGPPWSRVEELVALLDAGVAEIAGPRFTVTPDPRNNRFTAASAVPGRTWHATALLDARLPAVDLTRTTSPVLAHLRDHHQLTPYILPTTPAPATRARPASGRGFAAGAAGPVAGAAPSAAGAYVTGGVAVTARPFRTIGVDGAVHPRRYVYGVPTEGANWVTETGIRPCVNSATAGDSDAIARSVLGLPT